MRAPLPTTKPRSAGLFSDKAKMHLFKLFWFLGEHATLKPSRVKGLKSFQEVMMEKEKNGKQVPRLFIHKTKLKAMRLHDFLSEFI